MRTILSVVLVAAILLGHNEAFSLLRNKRQVTVAPCSTGTCLNGGVCQTFGNVATCACMPGYGGLFCQLLLNPNVTNPAAVTAAAVPSITNLCVPNPCVNGGRCVQIATNLAMCACPLNYVGVNCQIYNGTSTSATTTVAATLPTLTAATGAAATAISPLSICFPGACLNGGTCMTIGNLGLCTCLPNFSGSRCEFPQNGVTLPPNIFVSSGATVTGGAVTSCPSNNNPCLNSATCLLINNSPTCFCPGGLFPPFCSNTPQTTTAAAGTSTTAAQFGSCSPNPCLNNQPCISIQNQPVCFCGAGFLPPLCSAAGTTTGSASTTTASITAVNCPVSNPCNGAPCLIVNGNTQCFCPANTTPPFCTPSAGK